MRKIMLYCLICFFLLSIAMTIIFAQQAAPQAEPNTGKGLAARFGINVPLTQEQRQQLQAKIKELRQGGARPEEIRAAVQEMLKGWGIELPAGQAKGEAGKPDRGLGLRLGVNVPLTQEQRQQLQAKIKELRQGGARPEEIRAAVQEMLKGWGIELPALKAPQETGQTHEARRILKFLFEDLTDEQRQQIFEKIEEMKKAGAAPQEIRRAIMEMIQGFGAVQA